MRSGKRFANLLASNIPGLKVRRDYDLSFRTSMKMRASCAVHAEADTPEALRTILWEARMNDWPTYILGGGRNTLFATGYFDGVVIQLGRSFSYCQSLGGTRLRVGAATQLTTLLRFARDSNLMGLEFLTKVPGTVGGSLAGNAGAGGIGLCQFVSSAFCMTRDGFLFEVPRGKFNYDYRHSDLREVIVLEADLELFPMNAVQHDSLVAEYAAKKKNQPYDLPSSGCIFKNPVAPPGKSIPGAGKLIDESGLKGYQVRSAAVSEKHANFLVNLGTATGEDFLALISLVRDIVAVRQGIELETEVQIVGGPLNTALLA